MKIIFLIIITKFQIVNRQEWNKILERTDMKYTGEF